MAASRILFIIPPLTQLNTPYPSTAYLSGFLRSRGYAIGDEGVTLRESRAGHVSQVDLGIEMVLALLSREGLSRMFQDVRRLVEIPGEARQMLALERAYLDTIDPVVAFLQGREPGLAPLICQGHFLPRGPRFDTSVITLSHASTTESAKHLASLYVEDIADFVCHTVAPQFALSRYAEQVGVSAGSFDPVRRALQAPPSLTDVLVLDALSRHLDAFHPDIVGLTVPFPGNLYGALRIAQSIKQRSPQVKIILGGGYANTELRRLREPALFDYIDYVTLDDGERPLLCLLEHISGKRDEAELCRTFLRSNETVVFRNGSRDAEFGMEDTGTPTYAGLALDRYLSILDTLNPMHRLWSDGHWNKLTVAHGCYWKQCTFCDVGLDYIRRYDATPQEILADRVETLITETGRRAFHFVDEAAPPSGLKALALTLLERGVTISWWGNIRFEEAFTPDLCRLLAASGCIAVTAGLEVAADRLLDAMKKGITVDQTARVAAAFHDAGVLVHAYLMYGFPGQTTAETLESLERVRQLFARNLFQSAFWHKFTATAHSPIGLDPETHGIRLTGPAFGGFAENDLIHADMAAGEVPEWVGDGLRKALYQYKEGRGLEVDVRTWFTRPVPRPKVAPDWIETALTGIRRWDDPMVERRFVWIGGTAVLEGNKHVRRVILPSRTEDHELRLNADKAAWLLELIA
ncbi:MAG TPA: radical SAM protein, partial [Nitrospiraceae bacterium]|nr:radical SAM protein [Nitrospiraceae bacterium]